MSQSKVLLFQFVLEALRKEGMTPVEISDMFSVERVAEGYALIDKHAGPKPMTFGHHS